MEAKVSIWYLDDGNIADNYEVILRDFKNVLKL